MSTSSPKASPKPSPPPASTKVTAGTTAAASSSTAAASAAVPDGNLEFKKIAGKFDFTKSYARRRPDEPKSHYNARVKFIQALLKSEGQTITDERVEVLSHCFSNVKYLSNRYPDAIMDVIAKYDPSIQLVVPKTHIQKEEQIGIVNNTETSKVDSKLDSKESKESNALNANGPNGTKESNANGTNANANNDTTKTQDGPPTKKQKTGTDDKKGSAALLAAALEDSDSE